MNVTLSVIKVDIGSIGGHICPSKMLLETVSDYVSENGNKLLYDNYISSTEDDIAIVMAHPNGVGNEVVHKLAWNAFIEGTETAKGQDFMVRD